MTEPTTETATTEAAEVKQGEPAELGDAGKRAIQAEREARATADATARDAVAQLAALTEQHAAATAELDQIKSGIPATIAESLKAHVVALQGISEDDADLFLTSSDPETLLRQAARLAERTTAPLTPAPDLSQGSKGNTSPGSTGEAFADFIESKLV